MTTKDRLKEFLSAQKVGRNKFEEQIGVSTGYMSTKSATITSDVIEKTISAYPDLNLEWLITGNGDMIKSSPSETPMSSQKEMEYKDTIRELEAEVNQLKGENRILREQIGLGERKVSSNKSA